MNDFTKQELQQIAYHLENEPIELTNKIQRMIDNYCEHDYIPPLGSKISHVCGDCGKEIINE